MKKNIFIIEERNGLFPCFHLEIIFYSAELFDCALNFKFSYNIFIYPNIITNKTSKEQGFNCIRISYLFR